MGQLTQLQVEIAAWNAKNFPKSFEPQNHWQPLMGAAEELGETMHHYLKMEQGIRGDTVGHLAGIRDGIGDTFIYLCHFCTLLGLDIEGCVTDAWREVRQRDWQKWPKTGRPTEQGAKG
jgi:NTP pyrophosphatase (non-canonical NTP hydrolase)